MDRDYVHFVLVSGGRDHARPDIVYAALDTLYFLYGDLLVMHGAERGVDTYAEQWAKSRQQLYMGFPAQWDKYRAKGQLKRAGSARNAEMIAIGCPAQAVIFSGGRGTRNMLAICQDWYKSGDLKYLWLPEGEFWN